MDMKTLSLVVALAPLAGAILAGLFGRRIGRTGAHVVCILGVLAAFVASCALFAAVQTDIAVIKNDIKTLYNKQ